MPTENQPVGPTPQLFFHIVDSQDSPFGYLII